MRKHRLIAVLTLLALASAGCGSSSDPATGPAATAPPVGDAVDPTGAPPATEGPAADGASWPDGVTARLVSVQQVPRSWGVDVPASLAIVRLTLEVTNGSEVSLPVVPSSREMTVVYGPNRQEADSATGYRYKDPDEEKRKGLTIDGGTLIPVGGTATFVESALVPAGELDELAVVVEVPSTDGIREPYTLTGVQDLLKQVG